MTDRPNIAPGVWIKIGNTDCVVAVVRPPNDPAGDCEVVHRPEKPTNNSARWTGDAWDFVKTGDYGGYADRNPRLRSYVQILKRGRWAS